MNIKKKGQYFWIKVDTDFDVFDAEHTFIMEYFSDSSSTLTEVPSGSFEELNRVVSGRSAIVSEFDAVKDSYEFTILPGYTLKAGDVFSDGKFKYYIENIENNKIYLKSPLLEPILVNTVLTEVGNTGIYRAQLKIDYVGDYTIIIRNPIYGMQNIPMSVTIVDEDFNDLQNKVDIILDGGNQCKYKSFV